MSVRPLKGFEQVRQSTRRAAADTPAKAERTQANAFSPDVLELAAVVKAAEAAMAASAPKAPEKPAAPPVEKHVAIVTDAYQRLLGRAPDPEGLRGYGDQVKSALAAGKAEGDIVKVLEAEIRASVEYNAGHVDELVNGLYREHLGRDADPDGLKGYGQEAKQLLDEGKPVGDVRAAIAAHLTASAEYRAAHPTVLDTNRDHLYLHQPNDWSCGPTSLTMAMKALGMRDNTVGTVGEMAALVGATPATGVPGNASLIAKGAEKLGAQARFSPDGSPGAVRAALEAGHGVVLNGSLGTGGHFIYVAGLNPDGSFIICDPWRPEVARMNDGELDQFANRGPNPRGFAEIWK